MKGIERFLLENPGHTVKVIYSDSGWLAINNDQKYKFLLSKEMRFGIGIIGHTLKDCDDTLFRFLEHEPR